jgi:hypothetical protein
VFFEESNPSATDEERPKVPPTLGCPQLDALDHFEPGLGDVATLMAFTGLRWEKAVAVPIATKRTTPLRSWGSR